MTVKLLLVDDHQMMREGLRALIEKEPGMVVVGEADDGKSALALVARLQPQVVLMDVGLPELNGIETTRRLLRQRRGLKVVALSGHSDQKFVMEMLKAGASGYILKHAAYEDLARGIREVVAGRTYLSPEVTRGVVDGLVRPPVARTRSSAFAVLTGREKETLQALAEGKSTKEIAGDMGVSVKTVQTHRINILTKLNLRSVAELTKFAIREGFTEL
jgi:DNA-binding NarL/FixJ family response regulator